MAACRSCEAPIIWVTTVNGKRMPVDLNPVADGEWVVINGRARRATADDDRLRRPRFRVHWATCTDADQYRGPR